MASSALLQTVLVSPRPILVLVFFLARLGLESSQPRQEAMAEEEEVLTRVHKTVTRLATIC